MADNGPYQLLVTPRLRTITKGAVIKFEVTGGQLFIDRYGQRRYTSLRWYYFNDRDRSWFGDNQVYRQPKEPWKNPVEITFDLDYPGQWTVVARVTDMNGKEFFCSHSVWVENAWTVLGQELAAAQKEGLPDLYATMVMTTRYKRAVGFMADKFPPATPKHKADHAAFIEQLSQNEQKLADLHSEIVGCPTYKVNAVHIETTTQTKSRLRVLLAKTKSSPNTWKLIDWTNPLDRTRTGIYERTGAVDGAAIMALYEAWDSGNRYPNGKILRISPPQFFDEGKNYGEFETDGSSFWDSVASFFEWIALGAAVVAGVVTLVAPIPGSQVVSAAIWTSIFTSSAAAVINIAQRYEEGFSDWKADALDGLTIIGNIFGGAGMWARGANIITKDAAGKVVKYTLIGQVGTDGISGVLLAATMMDEYDQILSNPNLSPKERTDKLLDLFRRAAIAGTMTSISIKGTKEDLANLAKPGAPGKTPAQIMEDLKKPGVDVDATKPPPIHGESSAPDGHTTRTQDDHGVTRREDPTNAPPPKGKPRPRTVFPKPPSPNSRGMRDLDDKIFAAKAVEKKLWIIVRDGNADGVKFIGKSGVDTDGKPFKYEGKPETMKAKTATEGPYKGVVCFDPTHKRTHETLAELPGHKAMTVAELLEGKTPAQLMADSNSEFRKRYDYFKKHKIEEMGYRVKDNDNFVVVHKDTNARYHGDYDLHGVYKPDGTFVEDTSILRSELNDEMGAKMIQHGAHDEWDDRENRLVAGLNAGPQPPVTIYGPNGEVFWIGGNGSKAADRVMFKKFFEEYGLIKNWRYGEWEKDHGNKIDTGQ